MCIHKNTLTCFKTRLVNVKKVFNTQVLDYILIIRSLFKDNECNKIKIVLKINFQLIKLKLMKIFISLIKVVGI